VPEEDFHLSDQMRFQAHDSRFRGNDGDLIGSGSSRFVFVPLCLGSEKCKLETPNVTKM